jgi:hypothetical protein
MKTMDDNSRMPKRPRICGIYKILSPSGRIYIGQSINILKRWETYKYKACKTQSKLHNSFCKYGAINHIFEIIHFCEPKELDDLEKYYINFYDSCNPHTGLNCVAAARGKGIVSAETRKKLSIARLGYKPTKEHIENVRKNRFKFSSPKRKVIDIETGIVYESMKAASLSFGIKYTTLKMMLYEKNWNRTPLKLIV